MIITYFGINKGTYHVGCNIYEHFPFYVSYLKPYMSFFFFCRYTPPPLAQKQASVEIITQREKDQ